MVFFTTGQELAVVEAVTNPGEAACSRGGGVAYIGMLSAMPHLVDNSMKQLPTFIQAEEVTSQDRSVEADISVATCQTLLRSVKSTPESLGMTPATAPSWGFSTFSGVSLTLPSFDIGRGEVLSQVEGLGRYLVTP